MADRLQRRHDRHHRASMRPPDLPGGNPAAWRTPCIATAAACGFNEAAGFTRRKHARIQRAARACYQDASMRPPDLPGGNAIRSGRRLHLAAAPLRGRRIYPAETAHAVLPLAASMRPPDLPGGNDAADVRGSAAARRACFNEAAGFTRRKPAVRRRSSRSPALRHRRFNEAAGFTRRKRGPMVGPALFPVASVLRSRFNEAAGFTRRKPAIRWELVVAGNEP